MTRFRTLAASSVLFLMIAGVLGACSSADEPAGGAASSDGGGSSKQVASLERAEPLPAVAAYDQQQHSGAGTSTNSGVADTFAGPPSVGPTVIKTAEVDIEVGRDKLQEATRASISIAGRVGGFVLATSTEDQRTASSMVVLRVPADSFERALADLEALGEVKAERISGEDVGQEFVDLEARVRNLESQEAVLLRLMDRSRSVSDTIRVQRELQGVQLEIERLTGRLRYLRDQAEMGTVTLSFVEVGAPAHKPPSGVIGKAWAQAVDLALAVVAAVIVGTGFLIPVAALALIAFVALRALRPRLGA
jgi:hypothetical protein